MIQRAFLVTIFGLASAYALAEESKPAPAKEEPAKEAATPPAEAAPASSAATPAQEAASPATNRSSPAKPKVTHTPPAKPKTAHAPSTAQEPHRPAGISQSKFVGILYSEIARSRPEKNSAGPGVVHASFRVNGSGKIDNVSIKNSTSPAHADIVKKMLARVQTPPPPGGAFEGSQEFKFH